MEVEKYPYYIEIAGSNSTYVECVHDGKLKRGTVVDCLAFLKYEVEYIWDSAIKIDVICSSQLIGDIEPRIGDQVPITIVKVKEPIQAHIKKVLDFSTYIVQFKRDSACDYFTRDKFNEINFIAFSETIRSPDKHYEGPEIHVRRSERNRAAKQCKEKQETIMLEEVKVAEKKIKKEVPEAMDPDYVPEELSKTNEGEFSSVESDCGDSNATSGNKEECESENISSSDNVMEENLPSTSTSTSVPKTPTKSPKKIALSIFRSPKKIAKVAPEISPTKTPQKSSEKNSKRSPNKSSETSPEEKNSFSCISPRSKKEKK